MYLIMLLLWIILNGRITLEVLLLGVVICGGIYFFCYKTLGYDLKRSVTLSKSALLFIKYQFILVFEIIKSSFQTINIILLHSNEINPTIVRFQSHLNEEGCRILLANSITLTPGTLTVGLNDKEFVIHALDEQFLGDLEVSTFVNQLTVLEEKIHDAI